MHPVGEQIAEYLLGTLPDELASQVEEHLKDCAECEVTAINLEVKTDTVVETLREGAPVEEFADEPACQQMLSAIEALGHGKVAADAPVSEPAELVEVRDYQLLEKLGEGGMGTVYKALHKRLDRVVALKVLPAERLANADCVARFEREMKAVGKLNHPNIVAAHDAGEADGRHYLVMELIEGLNLSELVKKVGTLGVADACELVRQAASGLQYAHQQGMVHRDVKPSNLMLSTGADGEVRVKVLDLGLAVLGDQHADDLHDLTNTGQIMGTLDYMAPEQSSDSRGVDVRSDVYSLGATLFKLLTGDAPFSRSKYDSPVKLVRAIAVEPAPPVAELRDDLPSGLAAVVDRMLDKDPAQRFATVQEVAEVLEPFAAGANLAGLADASGGDSDAAHPNPKRERGSASETTAGLADASGWDARRRRRGVGVVLAMLGVIGVVAALIVYQLQTAGGTLVVEVDDADAAEVEAKLEAGGLTIVDSKNGSTWHVKPREKKPAPAGNYRVQLPSGLLIKVTNSDGVEFNTDQFVLKRKDTVVVRVSLAPAVVKEEPKEKPIAQPVQPVVSSDARQAAELLLKTGHVIAVQVKGSPAQQLCSQVEELPDELFDVVGVRSGSRLSREDIQRLSELLAGTTFISLQTELNDVNRWLEVLSKATSLDTIDVYSHDVSGKGLAWLDQSREIKNLKLYGANIVDADLTRFSRVQALHVTSAKIDGSCLKQLPLLHYLSLAGSTSDDTLLENLKHGASLNSVNLDHNRTITDDGLAFVKDAPVLTRLNLPNTNVSDAGLVHLQAAKQLEYVNVRETKVTRDGVEALRKALPKCEVEFE